MRFGIGKKKGKLKPAADAAGSAAPKPRKERKKKEKKPKKVKKAKEKKPKEKKPKAATSGRGIAVATPEMNLDTVLLGVAVLALTCGCLLLLVEISRFGGFGAITGSP